MNPLRDHEELFFEESDLPVRSEQSSDESSDFIREAIEAIEVNRECIMRTTKLLECQENPSYFAPVAETG